VVWQPVDKLPLTALPFKSQTFAYVKYASALTFSRALSAGFLNRLRRWSFQGADRPKIFTQFERKHFTLELVMDYQAVNPRR
jgi:hypothetical protein